MVGGFLKRLIIPILILSFLLAGCKNNNTDSSTNAAPISYDPDWEIYSENDVVITSNTIIKYLNMHNDSFIRQISKDGKSISKTGDYSYDIVYLMKVLYEIAKPYDPDASILDYNSNIFTITEHFSANRKGNSDSNNIYLLCFDGKNTKETSNVLKQLLSDEYDGDLSNISYEHYDELNSTDEINAFKNSIDSNGLSKPFNLNNEKSVSYVLINTSVQDIPALGLDKDTFSDEVAEEDLTSKIHSLVDKIELEESKFNTSNKDKLNAYIGENYNYSSSRDDIVEYIVKGIDNVE